MTVSAPTLAGGGARDVGRLVPHDRAHLPVRAHTTSEQRPRLAGELHVANQRDAECERGRGAAERPGGQLQHLLARERVHERAGGVHALHVHARLCHPARAHPRVLHPRHPQAPGDCTVSSRVVTDVKKLRSHADGRPDEQVEREEALAPQGHPSRAHGGHRLRALLAAVLGLPGNAAIRHTESVSAG